ncbi:hypothetical protein [Runella aurantiaca]|nr:hypothetical protein [Runella aurantiaca]
MNTIQKAGFYAFSALTMLAQGCGKNSDPTPVGPIEPTKTVDAAVVFNVGQNDKLKVFGAYDAATNTIMNDFDLQFNTPSGSIITGLDLNEPYKLVVPDNLQIAPESPANAASPNFAAKDPNKAILTVIAKDGSFGTIDVMDPETKKLVRQNVVAITVKTDDKTGIATEGMTKAIKTSGGFNGLLESVRKNTGTLLNTKASVSGFSTNATYVPYAGQ